MKSSEILRRARDRIKDPANWTKEVYARDGYGREVDPPDPEACSWCAIGSVMCEMGIFLSEYADMVRCAPVGYLFSVAGVHIPSINDDYGHDAVMGMFEEAIKRAEQQGD